ncbi:MAG TPA: alpha/beta hydrolase [Symbiobacteriaceae bacterium]|jgi:branched-chain amino acid transport system permease protein
MPTIRIANGLKIFYRECGSGNRTVVFIHGNVASSLWWEKVMQVLPPGVHGLAPDLRGCGDSDKPTPDWTLAEVAADVYQFMQALGASRATVVGHSFGGGVALQLAVAHPEAVEKLVLINSAPAEGLITSPESYAQIETLKKSPELVKMALAALMPTAPKDEFCTRLLDESVAKSTGAWVANGHALDRMNLVNEARSIKAPTLIIYGQKDPLVHLDMMERTRDTIPGAVLEVWEGVGHSAPVEAPLQFALRLVDFLAMAVPARG